MINLAFWLKKHSYRLDQVQTFYPSPMSLATAMYYSNRDPLKKISYKSGKINTPKTLDQRRFQKAMLRFHDEKNWPMLHDYLKRIGRQDVIGQGPNSLIPTETHKKPLKTPPAPLFAKGPKRPFKSGGPKRR